MGVVSVAKGWDMAILTTTDAGADPELDFGGRGLYCLFHVRSFLTLLFAVGNIAIWVAMAPLIRPELTVILNLIHQ